MRILQLDVDYVEFELVEPEIDIHDEPLERRVRVEDALLLLTSVEMGDSADIARKAVGDAAKFASQLKRNRIVIYPYAHLSSNLEEPTKAREILLSMKKEAEALGFEVYSAPFGWNKKLTVSTKAHPLAEQSRSYGADSQAAAQPKRWRHVELTEEQLLAKVRKSDFSGLPETDHRVIGEKLDLFSFQEVSPGMVYWHHNGVIIRNLLLEMIRGLLRQYGYIEISTPALANTALWRLSGHWDHYKDNMFLTSIGDEEYGLKPMNCPSTFLVYKSKRWSYRDLPLKIADFDPLFRNELSGVTSGLFRVKMFTQDDAHIFAAEDQLKQVFGELIELMKYLYGVFGLSYRVKVSTMPDDHLGSVEQWEKATRILMEVLKENGLEFEVKEKEGAFYGPKIDVDVMDSMGREWQCATMQLDFQMPQRFHLTYTGEDGKEHTPVVVHRVIYGSLERFIGILIEHFKGNFPVWIAPIQVRVLSVSEAAKSYAQKVYNRLQQGGFRVEVDVSNKTLEYKIREAELAKIPYVLVVGRREEEANTVSVRVRHVGQLNNVPLEEYIKRLRDEVDRKLLTPP
ncbi:MAG: threonine--tRNA ligase [Thermoprotei archaeon]